MPKTPAPRDRPRKRTTRAKPPERPVEWPAEDTAESSSTSRSAAGDLPSGSADAGPDVGLDAPVISPAAEPTLADAYTESVRAVPAEDRTPVVPATETWLPLLEDRSPNPWVCPFLRASIDGRIVAPIEAPDPSNRCAALRQAVPQSLRQQELVCLTSGHVDCPRYLRGALVIAEPVRPVREPSAFTPAILASLAILVLAFSASVAFVLARGGLELQALASVGPSASPGALAIASSSAAAVPTATPAPTDSPVVSPSDSPLPSASPSESPSSSPSAPPTPSPTPRSDRFALLTKCSNRPNCWIYTVRSGDNLFSIAHYFGVSVDAVHQMNPWTRTRGLRAGQQLLLPTPTR